MLMQHNLEVRVSQNDTKTLKTFSGKTLRSQLRRMEPVSEQEYEGTNGAKSDNYIERPWLIPNGQACIPV